MSLNEAAATRGAITKKQKQEALAAIYGVPEPPTESDIDRIRRLLSMDEAWPQPE